MPVKLTSKSATLAGWLSVMCWALSGSQGLAGEPEPNEAEILDRQAIERALAANPDDPRLQQAGRALLDALSEWSGLLNQRDARTPAAERQATAAPPLSNALSGMDSWDLNENYLNFAIADAAWTIDEDFPGTKLIVGARYSMAQDTVPYPAGGCDCVVRPGVRGMWGTLASHLQWGEGESGLEHGYLSVMTRSLLRNYVPESGRLSTLRDSLEWGGVLVGKDDPLGVEDYTEITVARLGRTWAYGMRRSAWTALLGLGASAGHAWATSTDPLYSDVSNPTLGAWFTLGLHHPRWGRAYVEQRVINGFTFSSPSAGDSTSRVARFRFGYLFRLHGCLGMELFVDKRSFNFSDHRLPDLYTKSRRIGAEFSCSW